jgi:hypothetical protein
MNSREVHKSRQHSIIVPLRKSYPDAAGHAGATANLKLRRWSLTFWHGLLKGSVWLRTRSSRRTG